MLYNKKLRYLDIVERYIYLMTNLTIINDSDIASNVYRLIFQHSNKSPTF